MELAAKDKVLYLIKKKQITFAYKENELFFKEKQISSGQYHLNLAAISFCRNNFPDALKQLEKAFELEPKNKEIVYCLVSFLYSLGNLELAINIKNTLEKSEKFKDLNYLLKFHLDLAQKYGQTGYLLDAEEEVSKAIRLDPKNLDSYFQRGKIYLKSKKWDQAIKDFSRSSSNPLLKEESFHYLGILYLKLGKLEESESYLIKASECSNRKKNSSIYLDYLNEMIPISS